MPALASSGSPPTILVTGASGFIATWIISTLLERGYKVRAAVRAEARGKHLLETFKEYGDKLDLHIVGDIKVHSRWKERRRALMREGLCRMGRWTRL
jgi:nucleoside-diphosphate-sugar epimerase